MRLEDALEGGLAQNECVRLVLKYIVIFLLMVLAAVHLLFAGANLQIGELSEAGVAAVAGVSLLAAGVMVLRGVRNQAALWVLLGTLPLTVWFAFTVPQGRSTPSLLFASLPTPIVAALYLVARRLGLF